MSEVMIDYVSVSLLLFVVFFRYGLFVPTFVNVFYCSYVLFMYMKGKKHDIAFAHFENCFRMQLIHLV